MTRNSALQIVTETINALDIANCFNDEQQSKINEALAVIGAMREQLSKPRANATEANEKRKEATAKARAELVATVAPILRKHLIGDLTAKELYESAASELPADFNWQKVQNVLLREMKDEVIKTEAKNKANTYRLK